MQASTRSQHRQGPREQLQLRGAEHLSDAELLAILLGTGTQRDPVAVLAQRLLEDSAGLHGLSCASTAAISAFRGIGPSKACRIRAALELGRRACVQPLSAATPLCSSADVDAALRPRLRHATQEQFLALALDAKNRPRAELQIALGGLTACAVSPADVFRRVLREHAAGVIFVHNHPSGEPAPSDDDVALTQRLVAAAQLLGLQVLDHVILGHHGYFSFLDAGLLGAA